MWLTVSARLTIAAPINPSTNCTNCRKIAILPLPIDVPRKSLFLSLSLFKSLMMNRNSRGDVHRSAFRADHHGCNLVMDRAKDRIFLMRTRKYAFPDFCYT